MKKKCARCGRREKLYEWNYCGDCIRELTKGGNWID